MFENSSNELSYSHHCVVYIQYFACIWVWGDAGGFAKEKPTLQLNLHHCFETMDAWTGLALDADRTWDSSSRQSHKSRVMKLV